MSLKSKKSTDFDRNLNSNAMTQQIRHNQYKGSEILKDTANSIAPIDTGKLRNNVSSKNIGDDIVVTWEQPYAGKVYKVNKKNPHTTQWIVKGFNKKRQVLLKIMSEGVVK